MNLYFYIFKLQHLFSLQSRTQISSKQILSYQIATVFHQAEISNRWFTEVADWENGRGAQWGENNYFCTKLYQSVAFAMRLNDGSIFFIACLALELLPVFGPLTGWCASSVFWMVDHTASDLRNVQILNNSGFRMSVFWIPTVDVSWKTKSEI